MKVISLGRACDTAHQIRKNFDQPETYPFDWLITPLEALTALVSNDFEGFLREENLSAQPTYVEDVRYSVRLLHDFPDHKIESDILRVVQEKYDRRISRWRDALFNAEKILFVRGQQYNDENVMGAQQSADLLKCLEGLNLQADWRLLVQNPTEAHVELLSHGRLVMGELRMPEPFSWTGDDKEWSRWLQTGLHAFG